MKIIVGTCQLMTMLLLGLAARVALANQDELPLIVGSNGHDLHFDWPMLKVGIAEYPDGPTGVTVFRFGRKVLGAVDVRGGAPGTVNTDYLRLGYEQPELDAVVFAGGSWYGLEATTAVATALKDEGERDGSGLLTGSNIALAVGAIIYDFGDRRLNEVYPDKRLAQAALKSATPGVFPLGAQGAGRFAKTGYYFGCNANSGQGGAFRQIGKIKIATFTVVNAYGVVGKPDGTIAACFKDPSWPKDLRAEDLLRAIPASRRSGWSATPRGDNKNTTISLVVTNLKMSPAELQRLAVQVHTSMGRFIQPFATQFDGDVLYAASTAEIDSTEADSLLPIDVGTLASETMGEAIENSVPDQQAAATPDKHPHLNAESLQRLAGDYVFSRFVSIRITARDTELLAQATGERNAYAIRKDQTTQLTPVSSTEFMVPGRYPLTLKFESTGKLVVNPGAWAQVGTRK